jgi:protein gp37
MASAVDMIGADRLARGVYWGRAWNLVGGCTHASAGCAHCWAEREAWRFREKPFYKDLTRPTGGTAQGEWTGEVRLREELLDLPLHVRKSTVWAIWTDLFHVAVPHGFIDRALDVMSACPQHRFLVLTKRAERIESGLYEVTRDTPCRELGGGDYLPNVALGATAENQEQADARIPALLDMPAAMRFVSCEPLLGPLRLDHIVGRRALIGWVIVGCESGPGRRPTRLEWVRDVVRQCRQARVPCFVKQIELSDGYVQMMVETYGGRVSHAPSEWPADVRVRQLPEGWLTTDLPAGREAGSTEGTEGRRSERQEGGEA